MKLVFVFILFIGFSASAQTHKAATKISHTLTHKTVTKKKPLISQQKAVAAAKTEAAISTQQKINNLKKAHPDKKFGKDYIIDTSSLSRRNLSKEMMAVDTYVKVGNVIKKATIYVPYARNDSMVYVRKRN